MYLMFMVVLDGVGLLLKNVIWIEYKKIIWYFKLICFINLKKNKRKYFILYYFLGIF